MSNTISKIRIDQTDYDIVGQLPEGYPYKEQSETLYISETKIAVSDPQEPVSVDTISVENNAKYKVIFDGTAYICTADAVNDYVGNMSFLDPTSFENTGEPFLIMTHNGSTMVFASEAGEHTFSVYAYSETIHPMAPEFLPAGVGGNDREFIVNITQDYHGAYGSEMTFAEILAQFDAGKAMVAYLTLPDNHCYKSCGSFGSSDGVAFFFMGLNMGNIGVPLVVMCTSDGVWSGQSASDLG